MDGSLVNSLCHLPDPVVDILESNECFSGIKQPVFQLSDSYKSAPVSVLTAVMYCPFTDDVTSNFSLMTGIWEMLGDADSLWGVLSCTSPASHGSPIVYSQESLSLNCYK